MAIRRWLAGLGLGGALALLAPLANAVTATPNTVTMQPGNAEEIKLSNVRGTIRVKNSTPNLLTVTKVNTTTYRLVGRAPGTAEIEFKDYRSEAKVRVTIVSAAPPAPSAELLRGRLLASNCFQCHGTNGRGGFERLAGENSSELYNELKEFATGREDATGIMAAHAMGFSDEQLRAIAAYLSSIR